MELSEIASMLNQMKEMCHWASVKLEEGLKQTQKNETKIYWLNVKIQNNCRKFTNEEIEMAENMEKQLAEITEGYHEMIKTTKDIVREIDTYMNEISERGDLNNREWLETIDQSIRQGDIYGKIKACLSEAQMCLEKQNEVLLDEKKLEDSLRERTGNKNIWWLKLKVLLKRAPM